MNRQKNKVKLFVYLIFLCISLLGCKTVPKVDKYGNPIYTYKIEEELYFDDVPEPYKYVFIRLYDVNYLNPFYVANVLKFGINFTEVNDIQVSHAAINFTLNDDFYGLTSGGEFQLAKESCTDTKSNKFMKKCDPDTSEQITFAIRVPAKEYDNMKKFVQGYAESSVVEYDSMLNFKIASFATKRKFFTKKEAQEFGNVTYPHVSSKENPDEFATSFVCSTFIAYALINNISSVAEWFDERDINYKYVSVSDLTSIPGVTKLFSSKFYEYNVAAEKFVEVYPEFESYLGFCDTSEQSAPSLEKVEQEENNQDNVFIDTVDEDKASELKDFDLAS